MKKNVFLLFLLFCLSVNGQTVRVGGRQMTVEQLKDAAEDYDANAQYVLAQMLLSGDKVETDSVAAVEYLLHSAAGGFLTPSLVFGNYHLEKANSNAEKTLLELCRLEGSSYQHVFQTYAGVLFFAKQDYDTAERFFKMALNNGNLLAVAELGLLYFYVVANSPEPVNGGRVKKGFNPDSYMPVMESWKMSDNVAAVRYLKKKQWSEEDNMAFWLSEAIDNDSGWYPFGTMSYSVYEHLLFAYTEGIGVPVNMEKAAGLACDCLDDEYFDDMNGIAKETLLAVLENNALISKPFLKSKLDVLYNSTNKSKSNEKMMTNHALAAYCLGMVHFKQREYGKAFKYLTESAEMGDVKAMTQLSECYRRGKGIEANSDKATYWEKKAKESR